MPIDVESRQVQFVKQLTQLGFSRNLNTNEFWIDAEYSTGFFDDNGQFHVTERTHQTHAGDAALWILGLRGSQGRVADPTLAEMFTQIFDGIETGQVVVPRPEPAAPEPSTTTDPETGA